ncbi:MAG: acyl-CoA/acyl-ACP dehydrogenase [Actinomycetota bacterium]|nr:acyl-CoA/acyl-ACP dehydrogenase [Actinomycetota bacterium]
MGDGSGPAPTAELVATVTNVADAVAAAHAADVDRRARFPTEALAALAAEGVLAALVPAALGGPDRPLSEVAESVAALGRQCASSAMVLAMHHIQVACLARHGNTPALRELTAGLVDRPLLLASATTEVGIGGDVRSSRCALERGGGRFHLVKEAPVISYGAQADAVLVTARRDAASPPNDQVLVVCRPPDLELEQVSEWDTLGFRGTCSPGFVLRASGDDDLVLPEPYGEISARTMLPVAHVLWGAVWWGIASAAAQRARAFVQAAARKSPGTPPEAARRVAELLAVHGQLADAVRGGARRFDDARDDPGVLSSVGFALAMNSLKVSASTLVVDVVHRAVQVCGMAGYRDGGPYGLGRHLRDAYGAALMVNNDRILGNNAQLLLVHRGVE